MATNVSNLAEAMAAAGFETNMALAEAAGVSPSTVGAILKRGTCNGMTAEKLQAACGEHKIGPLMQPHTKEQTDTVEDLLLERFPFIDFEGSPWFFDVVDERLVVTGTRLVPIEVDGETYHILKWGAVVYDTEGSVVAEVPFDDDSFWPPRREGKSLAEEANR